MTTLRFVGNAGEQIKFDVLGPLEVRRNGEALALGGARQRSLLALLKMIDFAAAEAEIRDVRFEAAVG